MGLIPQELQSRKNETNQIGGNFNQCTRSPEFISTGLRKCYDCYLFNNEFYPSLVK